MVVDPTQSAVGMALRPVRHLDDRRAIAYEVLGRPVEIEPDPEDLLQGVISLAPVIRPAVSVVPVGRNFTPERAARLGELARAGGVEPAEIVWLIPATGLSLLEESTLTVAHSLVGQGFRLALESVSLASVGRPEIAQLKPSFVFVDRHIVRRVESDQAARATISGLLAFFSRLGGTVVAEGVDDEGVARTLNELGLQLGSGWFLGPPVVLDAAVAVPGDELVSSGWFREQAGRALEHTTTEVAKPVLAELARGMGDGVDDRGFAHVLAETARRLQAEHDATRVLEIVGEMLPKVVPVDRLVIFEADWESYRMIPRTVVGRSFEGLLDLDDSLDSGITGWAFLRGEPYNCGDTHAHPEEAHLPGSTPGRVDESLVVVPLVAGDHRLGVLDVWRDGTNAFSDGDLERCELFGYLASAAWRNAQLCSELELRAITDDLTGLLNMRWWHELARREAAQAVRAGTSIALVLVDLDHFKRINDTLGHAVGDVVLRNAARALSTCVRTGDAAIRYGGDEFLLVLRDGDDRAAMRVAESVREALLNLPSPSEEIGPVTASIGVALFPAHGETLEEVVQTADRAMCEAKSLGRRQVRVYAAL